MRLELEAMNAELRALIDKYADMLAKTGGGGDLEAVVHVQEHWIEDGEYPIPTPNASPA
jgi:hypothetical protein